MSGANVTRLSSEERVVLLDGQGRAVGTAPKSAVHTRSTPLHLAFSCYVFDEDGRFLVTRRSRSKRTWPGVWTNSLCGHPSPGEGLLAAARRRAVDELGLRLPEVRIVLPDFRYQAVMSDGVRENEMCPVVVATTTDVPRADPLEVEEARWVPWHDFRVAVLSRRLAVSPWCRLQVDLLPAEPATAPDAGYTRLPRALGRVPRPSPLE